MAATTTTSTARLVRALGVAPLIARRVTKLGSGLGTQRWVVPRAFALLHWFRRLRIRWEIRDDIHEHALPSDARSSAGHGLSPYADSIGTQ
jgi:hypothetical protein